MTSATSSSLVKPSCVRRLESLRKVVPHAERANTASFLEEVAQYVTALRGRVRDLEAGLPPEQRKLDTLGTAPAKVQPAQTQPLLHLQQPLLHLQQPQAQQQQPQPQQQEAQPAGGLQLLQHLQPASNTPSRESTTPDRHTGSAAAQGQPLRPVSRRPSPLLLPQLQLSPQLQQQTQLPPPLQLQTHSPAHLAAQLLPAQLAALSAQWPTADPAAVLQALLAAQVSNPALAMQLAAAKQQPCSPYICSEASPSSSTATGQGASPRKRARCQPDSHA